MVLLIVTTAVGPAHELITMVIVRLRSCFIARLGVLRLRILVAVGLLALFLCGWPHALEIFVMLFADPLREFGQEKAAGILARMCVTIMC